MAVRVRSCPSGASNRPTVPPPGPPAATCSTAIACSLPSPRSCQFEARPPSPAGPSGRHGQPGWGQPEARGSRGLAGQGAGRRPWRWSAIRRSTSSAGSAGQGKPGAASSSEVMPWTSTQRPMEIWRGSPGRKTPASRQRWTDSTRWLKVSERDSVSSVEVLGDVVLVHEQDPVGLGVAEAEADIGLAAAAQRLQRVGGAGLGGGHLGVELAELLLADGEDELGLVGEVQVDRGRGDADGLGHGADGDRLLVARLDQQAGGRGQDLLAQARRPPPAGRAPGGRGRRTAPPASGPARSRGLAPARPGRAAGAAAPAPTSWPGRPGA